jgi:hypothetical protein
MLYDRAKHGRVTGHTWDNHGSTCPLRRSQSYQRGLALDRPRKVDPPLQDDASKTLATVGDAFLLSSVFSGAGHRAPGEATQAEVPTTKI